MTTATLDKPAPGALETPAILAALRHFVNQRPRLDPRNYARDWRDRDWIASYRSEARRITRDRNDALALLSACAWRDFTPAELVDAMRTTFSGRLSIEGDRLAYCTDQYWPTEYRDAVCAVLALALRRRWRADGCENVRQYASRELGRGIAARWFA